MSNVVHLPTILHESERERALALLSRYFGTTGESTRHEGASFETIGHRWDEAVTSSTVTSSDLLALSTLSVPVDGRAAIRVMCIDLQLELSRLLSQIDPRTSIIDDEAEALMLSASAVSELWRVLRSVPGFGPTYTSKLMARKRPRLIPIYDRYIRLALGLNDSRGHWARVHELLTRDSGAVYHYLTMLHRDARRAMIRTCGWFSAR